MSNFKQPMLACSLLPPTGDHSDDTVFSAMKALKYPVLVTLKMDGIRGVQLDKLRSRTLKAIPNRKIRAKAKELLLPGMDMELWNSKLEYHEVESIVMSEEHPCSDEINFHLLDFAPPEMLHRLPPYHMRMVGLCEFMQQQNTSNRIKFGPPVQCDNAEQLFKFFRMVEEEKGEGICFRTPDSPYKQGRSTLKEQYLIKYARMSLEEALVIGFIEAMENGNPEERNATGKMDRSTCAGQMYPKGMLGAFEVQDIKTGLKFKVGKGQLTNMQCREIWMNRDAYANRVLVYKCKRHGEKDKPRSPVFHGWRKEGY
jgi:DNA ligase-1